MRKMFSSIAVFVFICISGISLYASPLLSTAMFTMPFGVTPSYIVGTEALDISPSTLGNVKGNVGEMMTDVGYLDRLKKTGWQILPPRDGKVQGIDHFALKFNSGVLEDVLVVETKFTSKDGFNALKNTLDGRQMSRAWVEARVKKSITSKYDNFIVQDRDGKVRIVTELPAEGSVDLFPIDDNAYYFVDPITGEICFYSSDSRYSSSATERISRANNTRSNLEEHIRSGKFRRIIVHYEVGDNCIIRTEISLADGSDGKTSVVERGRKHQIIPLSEFDKVFNSDDYKQTIKAKYGLPDISFFDEADFDNSMKLKLITDIDSATANTVFSSAANRAALSKKFNLNPAIDYTRLDLSDRDWKNILLKKNLYDLDDGLVMKIRKASVKASMIGGVVSGSSAGALAGITNLLSQGIHSGFDNIDWKSVVYSSGMGISIGAFNTAGEAASRALIRVGNSNAAKSLSSFILHGAGVTLPFLLDSFVDVGFGIYNLYNGTYISVWQAAADIAVNTSINLGIIGLAALASSTIGGPVGTIVGIVGGSIWAFGSYYVINPITNSIERHIIFDSLESDKRERQIEIWTENALEMQSELF